MNNPYKSNDFNVLNKKDLKNILILLPVSLFAFFSNLWVKPADLMESRNFITAREMIENENYIITTLNGNLRFEKPPLPTWLTAFVMKITGNVTDEYLLRIPVAVTCIIFIILLYCFVKIMTENSEKSFITAFVGATTFMIIKVGNENTWDMYPYVFAFGAVTFILNGLKTDKLKNFIISGFFIAFSVLSKGPVGIYGLMIPFFAAHIYIFGIESYKKNWKKLFLMLLISVVLAGIWPFIVYLKYPETFLKVLAKEKNTWSHNHTKSIIYYSDYFIYMGIWIFFSVMTLVKSWNKKRTDNPEFSKFIFIWNILIIIFISVIKMKKKRYGVPIYMTSIIGVGTICHYYYNKLWSELKKSDKVLLYIQGIFMGVLAFLIPAVLFIKGYMNGYIKIWTIIISALIFIPFGYVTIKSVVSRNIWTIKFLIFGSGIFMLLANFSTNWFFNRAIIGNIPLNSEYKALKIVQKNPPALEIYSDNYEIEDVWRVGKQIKNYDKDTEIKNLPDCFIFFGKVPESLINYYKTEKHEIYIKDDNHIAELNYLKKL